MKLVPDLKTCFDDVTHLLASDDPVFFSRIGGSDTDAVASYARIVRSGGEGLDAHINTHMAKVSRFNGFYARSFQRENYARYCECLLETYKQTRVASVGGIMLSAYFKDSINPQFFKSEIPLRTEYDQLLEDIDLNSPNFTCYPYPFVERLLLNDHTLFQVFSTALTSKRVLVVSPFSRSITANFHNRSSFFKRNYKYPEFTLDTVDTPITYFGLPPEMYPHENWFETLEFLKGQISRVQFDIALMSCGSYAMPLGLFIEKTLGKKAVYVGGVLQLYFGVIGRRYRDIFFLRQINEDKFIEPLERDIYMNHISINDKSLREAFGAYF